MGVTNQQFSVSKSNLATPPEKVVLLPPKTCLNPHFI